MRARLLGIVLLLILPACHVAPPEVLLPEVPAGPLLETIAERRASFIGMKALARVTIERRGRTRVYESVAVLQQGFRKLKVEAYGPLGEPLVALLWDGTVVLLRKPGETEPVSVGQFGLEQVLGISIRPADLCALLTGNAPELPEGGRVRAGCGAEGFCDLDLRFEDSVWRVPVRPSGFDDGAVLVVAGADLYRKSRLALRSTFEPQGWSPASGVPKRVIVDDPERKVHIVVEYVEAEAGIPVEDGVFTLSAEEDKGTWTH